MSCVMQRFNIKTLSVCQNKWRNDFTLNWTLRLQSKNSPQLKNSRPPSKRFRSHHHRLSKSACRSSRRRIQTTKRDSINKRVILLLSLFCQSWTWIKLSLNQFEQRKLSDAIQSRKSSTLMCRRCCKVGASITSQIVHAQSSKTLRYLATISWLWCMSSNQRRDNKILVIRT